MTSGSCFAKIPAQVVRNRGENIGEGVGSMPIKTQDVKVDRNYVNDHTGRLITVTNLSYSHIWNGKWSREAALLVVYKIVGEKQPLSRWEISGFAANHHEPEQLSKPAQDSSE